MKTLPNLGGVSTRLIKSNSEENKKMSSEILKEVSEIKDAPLDVRDLIKQASESKDKTL